jgi:hypothetical protein
MPRREEQGSEVWRLADNVTCGVDSIEFVREGEPRETTVQSVLNSPGCALVIESEAVSTPSMTDEVMDCSEPIKGATDLTAKEGMKTLPDGGG